MTCSLYGEAYAVAIHKRIKRLCPPPETPHFNQLTKKEKVFVIHKVKGESNIQAVMKSHDVTTRGSAKSMASQLNKKPEVQMGITELMEHCRIDKPHRIRRLKQIIDSNDLNIAYKGLDMSFKLDGSYAPEQHEHQVDMRAISVELQAKADEASKRLEELRQQLAQAEQEEND